MNAVTELVGSHLVVQSWAGWPTKSRYHRVQCEDSIGQRVTAIADSALIAKIEPHLLRGDGTLPHDDHNPPITVSYDNPGVLRFVWRGHCDDWGPTWDDFKDYRLQDDALLSAADRGGWEAMRSVSKTFMNADNVIPLRLPLLWHGTSTGCVMEPCQPSADECGHVMWIE